MASGITNKGKALQPGIVFVAIALPTNYYLALVTGASVPDADTNLMSDLIEVAAGNGYTAGGISLTPGATDFKNLVEDDANNWGQVEIINSAWVASGGNIPISGDAPRYAVLTNDNGTVAAREVYAFFDLLADTTVPSGETLTLIDSILRFV